MIRLILGATIAHASPAFTTYFADTCDRYLIAADPTALEREDTRELMLLRLTLKARHHQYGHPLDQVFVRLITNELETREIIDADKDRM